jgi:hypothetical protein
MKVQCHIITVDKSSKYGEGVLVWSGHVQIIYSVEDDEVNFI